MNEEFLTFLWKYGLFDRSALRSDTGEAIEVLALGEYNTHAGPDFIQAKIRIGGTIWAGNVEVHLHASDWKKHRHHADKAYDNVILHVVMQADQPTLRTNGTAIPAVELPFNPQLFFNYLFLTGNKNQLSCLGRIPRLDTMLLQSWLTSLMVERLESRTKAIGALLERYRNDWEEVLYVQLSRNFGFHLNAGPFEQVARSLPLSVVRRHKGNLFQTEALFFGQAGFLGGEGGDEYHSRLKAEYEYLRKKYNLHPVEVHQWKFLRLRPANFPTVRLAQFASLINASDGLFRKIIESESLSSLVRVFSARPSPYWETHYRFGTVSDPRDKILGEESSRTLLINTVIPLVFLYGHSRGDDTLKARAIDYLDRLPAEKNAVVTRWEKACVRAESALDTQALLQVYSQYCLKKQCLRCMIGNRIITGK